MGRISFATAPPDVDVEPIERMSIDSGGSIALSGAVSLRPLSLNGGSDSSETPLPNTHSLYLLSCTNSANVRYFTLPVVSFGDIGYEMTLLEATHTCTVKRPPDVSGNIDIKQAGSTQTSFD